jgi:uncharacterized protein YjdB
VQGNIEGTVTNGDTGEPVQTVEVMLTPSGKTAITGSDGYYRYSNLDAGEYTVQVRKTGFQTNVKRITVQQGETAKCDVVLYLGSGFLTVNKTALDFGTSDSNMGIFEIGNSGQAAFNWSVSENCDWITTVNPQQGTLAAGGKQSVTVTIDRAKAPQDNKVHAYDLLVESNSGTAVIIVSVGGQGNGGGETDSIVTGVTVSPTEKQIVTGEKFTLTATVTPTNASNKTVTWSSGNTAVATVNASSGEVTGVTAGSATVTATTADGGKTANCVVTVTQATGFVVTGGLVAYYTFDNENCNEARDNSQYNGIKSGSGNPTWSTDVPGSAGKSLQLSNNVFFSVATSPFGVNINEYSASLWIKTMSNNIKFYEHEDPPIDKKHYPMEGIQSDSKIGCIGYNGGLLYNAVFDVPVNATVLDGDWHLITITKVHNTQQWTDTYKLYIDGVYIAQKVETYMTVTASLLFMIGKQFTGKMDNFRVYNRALTQAEITEIFNTKQ